MTDQTIFNTQKAYGEPELIGVLLSGGVDSTTALAHAINKNVNSDFVTFSVDYGQRHIKEIDSARRLAESYGADHRMIDLRSVIPHTTLKDADAPIPDVGYEDLTGVSPTYVPFRNGLMISAAVSTLIGILEESIKQGRYRTDAVAHLYAGMHAEDAASFAYPDCTPEFAGSMQNAIWMGTYGKVRLITPFINSSKADIVRVGYELDVPWELTWSCYKGEALHCGVCPTCRARRKAFVDADVFDRTVYQQLAEGDPGSSTDIIF